MGIIYLLVVMLVTVGLLAIPIFPFWKLQKAVRDRHPKIWNEKGPFDPRTLLAHGALMEEFGLFIRSAPNDEELKKSDPALVRLAVLCGQIMDMLPRSFIAQIGYVIVFLYFVSFFVKLIFSAVG